MAAVDSMTMDGKTSPDHPALSEVVLTSVVPSTISSAHLRCPCSIHSIMRVEHLNGTFHHKTSEAASAHSLAKPDQEIGKRPSNPDACCRETLAHDLVRPDRRIGKSPKNHDALHRNQDPPHPNREHKTRTQDIIIGEG